MIVAELKAAECTVVERKSDQAKQSAQRVQAHRIDVVFFPEPAKFKIVTFGTVTVPLEKSKEGAIVITVCAAMGTVESGAAKNTAEKTPAFSFVHFAASYAAGVDSSKEQTKIPLFRLGRMCKEYHEC
ncbi:MAG TPA: hypothetical protein VG273_00685 [Bryobacteraceae bacterium]|jgi:hypothetical protein|nr:hypothetical protein [Bryobacteraceae bacterium]